MKKQIHKLCRRSILSFMLVGLFALIVSCSSNDNSKSNVQENDNIEQPETDLDEEEGNNPENKNDQLFDEEETEGTEGTEETENVDVNTVTPGQHRPSPSDKLISEVKKSMSKSVGLTATIIKGSRDDTRLKLVNGKLEYFKTKLRLPGTGLHPSFLKLSIKFADPNGKPVSFKNLDPTKKEEINKWFEEASKEEVPVTITLTDGTKEVGKFKQFNVKFPGKLDPNSEAKEIQITKKQLIEGLNSDVTLPTPARDWKIPTKAIVTIKSGKLPIENKELTIIV